MATGTGSPGFFPNLGLKLPFGMSNVNNAQTIPTAGNPGQPAQGGQPGQGQNPAQTQLQPKNNNSVVQPTGTNVVDPSGNPDNNPDPNKGGGQGSQMDAYTNVFRMPVGDDGKPIFPVDPMASPVMTIDPSVISKAAKQMNFAAGITPEQITAAQQDPVKMMELMNIVAQNGFTAAVTGLSSIVNTAVEKNNERFEQALPDRIRSTQINQLQATNPVLNHPAAAPMLAALKTQISTTNPQLPPNQVASMAEGYITAMVEDMNKQHQQQTAALPGNKPKEVDWAAFLESPSR